jgi:prepilin peptidase CpaA
VLAAPPSTRGPAGATGKRRSAWPAPPRRRRIAAIAGVRPEMLPTVSLHAVVAAAFVSLLATALVTDVSSFRIPNWLTAGVALLYPLHVGLSPLDVAWLPALGLAALVFAAGTVAFACRWMGGGDVKLLAATTLWAGPAHALEFLTLAALIGGALALLLLLPARYAVAAMLQSCGAARLGQALLASVVPYGVAIAAAGVIVLTKPVLGVS